MHYILVDDFDLKRYAAAVKAVRDVRATLHPESNPSDPSGPAGPGPSDPGEPTPLAVARALVDQVKSGRPDADVQIATCDDSELLAELIPMLVAAGIDGRVLDDLPGEGRELSEPAEDLPSQLAALLLVFAGGNPSGALAMARSVERLAGEPWDDVCGFILATFPPLEGREDA